MVVLNRIYTRTGDGGATRLANGAEVAKTDLRVEAYGSVDETNACLGLARLHTGDDALLDPMLKRIQNDLFDLGADLANPPAPDEDPARVLRVTDGQVTRLEQEIDQINADLSPLTSFVLPGGTPAAAALHQARTVCRRAERAAAHLSPPAGPTGKGRWTCSGAPGRPVADLALGGGGGFFGLSLRRRGGLFGGLAFGNGPTGDVGNQHRAGADPAIGIPPVALGFAPFSGPDHIGLVGEDGDQGEDEDAQENEFQAVDDAAHRMAHIRAFSPWLGSTLAQNAPCPRLAMRAGNVMPRATHSSPKRI